MKRATTRTVFLASLGCVVPTAAYAHSFATPYVLPVPFWMYVYGCVATLVVSFAVFTYFLSAPIPAPTVHTLELGATSVARTAARWALRLLRAGAVASLVLVIVAGLVGTGNPGRNINMILFWIVFLLGFTYVTLIVGDLYALINPWKVIIQWLERLGADLSTPRLTYPQRIGYWPALWFYMILIWIELFVLPSPFVLSLVLVTYGLITIAGVVLLGKDMWFERCDCFSVFFRLVATLAPVEYQHSSNDQTPRIRIRPPCVGVMNERPEHISLVLFVLFMLSSTTYDAIYRTMLWVGLYWRPLLALLQPLWGTDLAKAQSMLADGYIVYQRGGLLLSPALYFALYLLALWVARMASTSRVKLQTLAMDFAYSLIPIAFAYNFTHYYPMLVAECRDVMRFVNDPLGLGWTVLNRVSLDVETPPLEMAVVWHIQVAVILIGHVVSVYVAHRIAIRTFPTRRQVTISQLPLLLLMVAYTATGLWILSLPLVQ